MEVLCPSSPHPYRAVPGMRGFRLLLALVLTLATVASLGMAGASTSSAAPSPRPAAACSTAPVNPNANARARNLLCYVVSQYGNHVLSGQQESTWIGGPEYEMEYIRRNTGRYPAIRSLDYGDSKDFASRAIAWWRAGGIPMIGYHMGAPTKPDTYEGTQMAVSINAVLSPGTAEHASFVQRLDGAAAELKKLKDAGVPAIWRPFHEAGGTWFWWSKEGGSQYNHLWRFMFDYFTRTRGLDNLIWLHGFNGSPQASFYPGKSYVDIDGADTYAGNGNYDPQKAMYVSNRAVVGSSIPIALHENGPIPDPGRLQSSGARWVLFNTWHGNHLTVSNSVSHLNTVYNHSYVITRDEVPNLNQPFSEALSPVLCTDTFPRACVPCHEQVLGPPTPLETKVTFRRVHATALRLLVLPVLTAVLVLLIPTPAQAADPVRVMPLGDSITGSPGCWRAALWQKTVAGGQSADFVGTLRDPGCGVSYDGDNEGHGGYLATNIADQNLLPGWLSATRPDVVMMHLGTNDVWSNIPSTTILAAYSKLVRQMRASNPSMRILVAQILPMNPSGCSDCGRRVVSLNAAIPGWATANSTTSSPITVVDQWSGFRTATDTSDGVHPNSSGNTKITDRWYPALSGAIRSHRQPLRAAGTTSRDTRDDLRTSQRAPTRTREELLV